MAGSRSGPLRPREGRGEGGEAGGRTVVANAAEASKMLDGLLEEQQELEAFLEEEFAKRESAAAAASGGGERRLSQRQQAG